MNIFSLNFPIKNEFVPELIYVHEIVFDNNKIMKYFDLKTSDELRSKTFALTGHLMHLHNNTIVNAMQNEQDLNNLHPLASDGKNLISDTEYDSNYVKNLLDKSNRYGFLKDIILDIKVRQINYLNASEDSLSRYFSSLFYLMARIKRFLPLEFIREIQGNVWVPTKDSPILVLEERLSGTNFYVQRAFFTKIFFGAIKKPYLYIDLHTWTYNKSNLWETIKTIMNDLGVTLDEVVDDNELQAKIFKVIRSNLPELQTTYDNFDIGISTRQKGRLKSIIWVKDLKELNGGDLNGVSYDLYEYHTKIGNNIVNPQPIAIIKTNKEITFPVELLRESPNFPFLRRRGISEQALTYMKPDESGRILSLLNLISPFGTIIDLYPLNYTGEQVSGLFREIQNAKSKKREELYDRGSTITRFISIGDFKDLVVVIPSNISPKLNFKIEEIISYLDKNIPKVYSENGIPGEYKKLTVNDDDPEKVFEEIKDYSISLWFLHENSDAENDKKWKHIKALSMKKRHLTQLMDLNKFVDTADSGIPFYINNIIRQIFYKCGGITYNVINTQSTVNILYIGLDRIPSNAEEVGYDVGAAMMMSNGEYIEGMVHSYPDARKNDKINIGALFTPKFMEKIKTVIANRKIEHVVVLRDSGTRPWMEKDEIEPLQNFFSSEKIDFSYISVNKSENHRFYNLMSKKPEFSNKDSIQLFNDINIINQEDINNVKRWSALERKFNKTLREFGIEFELPLPIAINHPSHNNIFYLQTTRPTSGVKTSIKYEILYNQWKNKSDSDLKEQLKGDLSALCKAVEESGAPTRLPAPVYYADKLAGWIRDVKEFPPEEFKNKVFFA